MKKHIHKSGQEHWTGVKLDSPFSADLFHRVVRDDYDDNKYWALHTEHFSLTIVDRMTGFGYRDIETGYRESPDKGSKFWLASGDYDVRDSGCQTIGEAIDWVKERANSCVPKEEVKS